jgi:hypothetical protein
MQWLLRLQVSRIALQVVGAENHELASYSKWHDFAVWNRD